MPWVEAFIRWAKPYVKTAGIALAVFVVVSLVIWLIIEVLIGAAETVTYGYVLRLLTTEGGVKAALKNKLPNFYHCVFGRIL